VPSERQKPSASQVKQERLPACGENALLRKPLIILRRQVKRPACTKTDRMLLVLLAKMARNWKQALFIVQPETLLRWHRQGFKLYWKYKSRAPSAKPKISAETVALIKEMASNNRLWGAERIRGELLKLGIQVCKRTIQKYMRSVRTSRPGGQKWSTFLHTHAEQIWACDASPSHRPLLSLAGRPSSSSNCTRAK
jgi:putative transposase